MTGAQFRRTVSNDPEKWAAQFLQAYCKNDELHTDEDALAFVTSWFRDAMDAAAAEAVR